MPFEFPAANRISFRNTVILQDACPIPRESFSYTNYIILIVIIKH